MLTGNRKTNKNRKSQAGNGTIKRHWLERRGKEDTGFGRKNKRHCGDRKAVRHMVRTEKFNNTRFGQQKHYNFEMWGGGGCSKGLFNSDNGDPLY